MTEDFDYALPPHLIAQRLGRVGDGVVTTVTRENIPPTQGCGCRRGCGRTVVLRPSQNHADVRRMLRETNELSHGTQILIQIIELI